MRGRSATLPQLSTGSLGVACFKFSPDHTSRRVLPDPIDRRLGLFVPGGHSLGNVGAFDICQHSRASALPGRRGAWIAQPTRSLFPMQIAESAASRLDFFPQAPGHPPPRQQDLQCCILATAVPGSEAHWQRRGAARRRRLPIPQPCPVAFHHQGPRPQRGLLPRGPDSDTAPSASPGEFPASRHKLVAT